MAVGGGGDCHTLAIHELYYRSLANVYVGLGLHVYICAHTLQTTVLGNKVKQFNRIHGSIQRSEEHGKSL